MPAEKPYPPGLMLRALSQLIRARLGARLSETGLTVTWFAVMEALDSGATDTGADLARHFHTDPTAVTRTIDRMEKAGLVERLKDGADRRRYNIVLTPKARQLMPTARQVAAENEDLFFGALAERERRVFEDLLAKLIAKAESAGSLIDWE